MRNIANFFNGTNKVESIEMNSVLEEEVVPPTLFDGDVYKGGGDEGVHDFVHIVFLDRKQAEIAATALFKLKNGDDFVLPRTFLNKNKQTVDSRPPRLHPAQLKYHPYPSGSWFFRVHKDAYNQLREHNKYKHWPAFDELKGFPKDESPASSQNNF